MPRYYLSGVVLPERAQLTVSELRSQIMTPAGGVYMSVAFNIYLNQITATVDTDEADLHTIRNLVRREAEFITDLAGFLLGRAYDVEITKVFGSDLDPTYVFGVEIPVIGERAKVRDLGLLLNRIAPLCYGPEAIFLRRCLTDLSFAIKRPDDTAFYCFRAIESLRHSFGGELSERDQWLALSQAVGSTKADMDELREHAFPARHGAPLPASDEQRQKFFIYTWQVVERYIDYRLLSCNSECAFS